MQHLLVLLVLSACSKPKEPLPRVALDVPLDPIVVSVADEGGAADAGDAADEGDAKATAAPVDEGRSRPARRPHRSGRRDGRRHR